MTTESSTTKPFYAKRDYLSISTLMDFIRCPRRYFYKKSGLTPRTESNALLYGTAMHKAVPRVLIDDSIESGFNAFKSVWDESLADDKRNLARAAAQLANYHYTHTKGRSIFKFEQPPSGVIKLEESTSEYEIPAVLEIGLSIPLVVRIDGLVRHRDTGELWGWEFKTASRVTSNFFDNMEFNPQILAYTLALRTLTGLNVRGMIAEAMLVDKSKTDNLCHPIPVQDHLVADVLQWLKYWGTLLLACEARALETLDSLDPASAFPKNFAGCSAYPHYYIPSFPCDYSMLCRVPDWRALTSMYDIRPDHKFVQLGETQ